MRAPRALAWLSSCCESVSFGLWRAPALSQTGDGVVESDSKVRRGRGISIGLVRRDLGKKWTVNKIYYIPRE